jgi:hypothetical protein
MISSKSSFAVACVTCLSGTVAACGGDVRSGSEEETISVKSVEEGLIFKTTEIWTVAPAAILKSPLRIPVCFEHRCEIAPNGMQVCSLVDGSTQQFREWVRDAVTSSWQRYARINFTEWDACTNGEPGIHVFLDAPTACTCTPGQVNTCNANCPCPAGGVGAFCNGTGTPGGNVGRDAAADGPQGYLAFYDGTNWRNATTARATGQWGMRLNQTVNKQQTYPLAVHEFGHAIGFYHEHQRPGSPLCPGNVGSPVTATAYGAYDGTSIMSYCGITKWGLSPNDIMAVQRLYGRRTGGQIVSRGGNCLAVNEFDTSPFLWNCDEQNQLWRRDGAFGLYYQFFPSTAKCLGWNSSPPVQQSLVATQECIFGATGSQAWVNNDVELRGVGGKCLTHKGSLAQLTVEPCSSENTSSWSPASSYNVNQKWYVDNNKIRWKGDTTRCVAVNSTGNTAIVRDGQCTAGQGQIFTFQNNGTIKNAWSGRCFDVAGPFDSDYTAGNGGPGQNVQIFDCDSASNLNQKWNFSGQWKNAGQCMDRPGGHENIGQAPWAWPCAANPDDGWAPGGGGPDTGTHRGQQWDYYFHINP